MTGSVKRKEVVRRIKPMRFEFSDFAVPRAGMRELQVIGMGLVETADPEAGAAERAAVQRLNGTLAEIAEVKQKNVEAAKRRTRPAPHLRRDLVKRASAIMTVVRAQQRATPNPTRAAELRKVLSIVEVLARPAQQRNRSLCHRVDELEKHARVPARAALLDRYLPPGALEELFAARDALQATTDRPRGPKARALPFFMELLRTRIAEYVFSVLGTTDVEVATTRVRALNVLQVLLDARRDRSKARKRRKTARAKKAKAKTKA